MVVFGKRIYPRGPDVRHLEKYTLHLSGTKVNVAVPKSNFGAAEPAEEYVQHHNLYDLRYLDSSGGGPHEPEVACFVARFLEYDGVPLLRGYLGDIRIKIIVTKLDAFNSLFRPRRLECAIERAIYLRKEFGTGVARNDWKVQVLGGCRWANYRYRRFTEAAVIRRHIPGRAEDDTAYGSVWSTPITDDHLFTVCFAGSFLGDPTSMLEAFNELEGVVMDSVHVELSGDARRQKGAAECAYPHEALSRSLPPYEFEKAELLDELDVIRKVSASLDHDSSISEAAFDKLVKEAMQKQREEVEEVRQRVLASHLRFDELEEQDYANSISEGCSS